MDSTENRYEERLAYRWPVWFGEDMTQMIHSGLMLNVSSTGIAFTIQAADRSLVQAGRGIAIRFSLPRFDEQDTAATVGVTRTGRVRWINAIADGYKIGLQFDTPLSLKPAEQAAATTVCTDAKG